MIVGLSDMCYILVLGSANFILEMVTCVVFLAFVSNKWWNNYSWPSLPLSFIFHSEIRPLYFTIVPRQMKCKRKKKSKTTHTSRKRASLPISDVIVGSACHRVFGMIGIRQFSFCPKSAGGLLWWCYNPQGALGGCRHNFVAAFNFKTNSESEGQLSLPLSPS